MKETEIPEALQKTKFRNRKRHETPIKLKNSSILFIALSSALSKSRRIFFKANKPLSRSFFFDFSGGGSPASNGNAYIHIIRKVLGEKRQFIA